jgi:hypothetical protein
MVRSNRTSADNNILPVAVRVLIAVAFAITLQGANCINIDPGSAVDPDPQSTIDSIGGQLTLTDNDCDGSVTINLEAESFVVSDGNIVSAVWQDDGQELATGNNVTVTLGLGVHAIDLTVENDLGETDTGVLTLFVNPGLDGDGDGVCVQEDNCPNAANADQADDDGDGAGDACDVCPGDPEDDQDQDGICGDLDNCLLVSNPDQANADGDLEGDACDNDDDNDGVVDADDNCPKSGNSDQADSDADTAGDACDICPHDAVNDEDADEICGDIDNCPVTPNTDQADEDGDGLGDVCEPKAGQVCQLLRAKADAVGLSHEAVAFTAPWGDGRSGANGFVIEAHPAWPEDGTRWELNWTWSGSARTAQIIHPWDDGHIVVSIFRWDDVKVTGVGRWTRIGWGHRFLEDDVPINTTDAFDVLLPLVEGEMYTFASELDSDGSYRLFLNGLLIVTATTTAAEPLDLFIPEGVHPPETSGWAELKFEGAGLPDVLLPGQAGVIVGPRDNGINEIRDIEFFPIPAGEGPDPDEDGVLGGWDNCPFASNVDQRNSDGDRFGDACDACPEDPDDDLDRDGVCGDFDNCPLVPNPDQIDGNSNGLGDACEGAAMVCRALAAKRDPVDLVIGSIAFTAPPGDGRRGANGFLIPSDASWQERGTEWNFLHRFGRSSQSMQVIHPWGDGHVLVTLQNHALHVSQNGDWSQVGWTPGGDGIPLQTEPAHDEIIPLVQGDEYSVSSRLGPEGNYSVSLNNRLVATATITDAEPLSLGIPEFEGVGLPEVLLPGQAGVIMGPIDTGSNHARYIVLSPAP